MRPIAFTAALLSALLMSTSHAAAAGGWTWPVRGQVVTQFRNGDDPYAAGQHRGVDLAAPVGTPVVAATAGTIVYAGVVGSSGLTVAERTSDGRYELSYLHLSAASVQRGQAVGPGTSIGAVGVTGRRSVAQPHLHFGVREAADRHAYLDPLRFLAPPPGESPSPRPVPVPVSVPIGVAPLPETVPALASEAAAAGALPAPAPAPSGRPAPVHLPGPAHAAATAPSPARAGALAPHPAGEASLPTGHATAGAERTAPRAQRPPRAHGRAARHEPTTAHRPAPAHGPTSRRAALAGGPARLTAGAHADATHGKSAGGFDVGWLAACLGLVAAAALLAGPGAGGARVGTGRAAFATLLRAASRG